MRLFDLLITRLFIILLLMSCSDFLEEKSQDEVIPTSVSDYNELFLPLLQVQMDNMIYYMDDDVAIDESQFWGDNENWTASSHTGDFTWQPDMWERENTSMYSWEYTETYNIINGMNVILWGVEDALGTDTEKELVRAKALVIRAYNYLILVNLFGEPYNYNKEAPGIVLKSKIINEAAMARSTVSEVYEQIVEDLETASAIFAKYPKTRGDYMPNTTATDIILSRVYLYMEEWDKAIIAADRAIASSEGLTNYTALPEGRYYMTSYDNIEVEWLFASTRMDQLFIPSESLMALFNEHDRRQDFLVHDVSDGWVISGIIKKDSEKLGGPNVMIRTAEAFLNRAEAKVLADTPDTEGALEDLNELRRHRIVGYQDISITDPALLLEEIRNERRLELCFEGHRWYDLRRYGMPAIYHDFRTSLANPLLRYTLQEKDPLYTLPFPSVVVDNNVLLEQNVSALEPIRGGAPL